MPLMGEIRLLFTKIRHEAHFSMKFLSDPLRHQEGVKSPLVEFLSRTNHLIGERAVETEGLFVGDTDLEVRSFDVQGGAAFKIELHELPANPLSSVERVNGEVENLRLVSDVSKAYKSGETGLGWPFISDHKAGGEGMGQFIHKHPPGPGRKGGGLFNEKDFLQIPGLHLPDPHLPLSRSLRCGGVRKGFQVISIQHGAAIPSQLSRGPHRSNAPG